MLLRRPQDVTTAIKSTSKIKSMKLPLCRASCGLPGNGAAKLCVPFQIVIPYADAMPEREFERIIAEGQALQSLLPDLGLIAVVPTIQEMLRVKAFLLAERRATRDYIDMAALADRLGVAASLNALASLNLLYPSAVPQSLITRLAEACESEPVDLERIPLNSYRQLKAPFTEWAFVAGTCQRLGRALLRQELEGCCPARATGATIWRLGHESESQHGRLYCPYLFELDSARRDRGLEAPVRALQGPEHRPGCCGDSGSA